MINDAATKLRQIAERQDMHSKAVDAFRDTAREVADDISRAHERYDGVGQAAVGALRVSALGARGASRLAAGRLAARSVLKRATAGLPRSSSAMSAIKSMLGTANPMTRGAARAAARRSLEQGFVPSASSIGRSLRAIPSEFADNVRTLRHADWRDALRQARQSGRPHVLQFLGEHDADADLQSIKKIHGAVRASDEVAPHLRQLQVQQRVLISTATHNVYDIGRDIAGFAPSSSAAQELHLPPSHQPVGAGARP